MAFGIFTGTFSSIYVAAPVLLWIERRWPREISTAQGGPAMKKPAPRPQKPTEAAGVR
jgi:hypothetical protein